MKNLTEKQQLIIEEITSEFNKINEEKKKLKKGTLLKLNEIVEQKENDLELRKTIELHNEAFFKNFLCIVDDAINKLNSELLDYGLIAFKNSNHKFNAKHNLSGISIYIDKIDYANQNKTSKYGITIRAINETFYKTFESKIEGIEKYVNFQGFKSADSYGGAYKNIEEFAEKSSLRANLNYLLLH
jgi:hypothetical protein